MNWKLLKEMNDDEKEKFIDSLIVISDGSISQEIEKRIKSLAYSVFFGSKRMNILGIKVEDANELREQNKRPYISGKWKFIKNLKKVSDFI